MSPSRMVSTGGGGKCGGSHLFDYLLLSGDPSGRHVVIVDDLVQTGGTLIECSKVSYLPFPVSGHTLGSNICAKFHDRNGAKSSSLTASFLTSSLTNVREAFCLCQPRSWTFTFSAVMTKVLVFEIDLHA